MGVQIPPPLPGIAQDRPTPRLHNERELATGTMAKAMADEIGVSKNYWRQLRDYFGEVRGEMKRVTWPGKQEIYGTTVMVILTTFLF